jgi:hypothetical protein
MYKHASWLMFILVFFYLHSKNLYADRGDTAWEQLVSPHFTFIVAKDQPRTLAYLESKVPQFEFWYERFKTWFPEIPDSIPVLLDPRQTSHNGSAATLPFPRIVLNTAPPPWALDLGESGDYLSTTFLHELAHIAHLTHKSPAYQTLSQVFGEIIAPAGLTPRWLMEGFAIWAETVGTQSGRGRGSFYEGLLPVLVPVWPPLEALSGFPQLFPGGRAPYFFGYLFVAYLDQRWGTDLLIQFMRGTGETFPGFYDLRFKDIYQKPLSEVWNEAKLYYEQLVLVKNNIPPSGPANHLQPIWPKLPPANLRSDAVKWGEAVYFWDLQPDIGARILKTHLNTPQSPAHTVYHLTPPQPVIPDISVCHDTLYALFNELSLDGFQPKLGAWRLPEERLTFYPSFPEIRSRLVDLHCVGQTLYALGFDDMAYQIFVWDLENQRWHLKVSWLMQEGHPVDWVTGSPVPQLLIWDPDIAGRENPNHIWTLGKNASLEKRSLNLGGGLRIYELTTQPGGGHWAIADSPSGRAPSGRVLANLDSQGNPTEQLNLDPAIFPLQVMAWASTSAPSPTSLGLRGIQGNGEQFYALTQPQQPKAVFAPSARSRGIHSVSEVHPHFLGKTPEAPTSLETHAFSAIPRFWTPLLTLRSTGVTHLGFRTQHQDLPPTFGYTLVSLFSLNPFANETLFQLDWNTFVSSWGPLLYGRYDSRGQGLNADTKTLAAGVSLAYAVSQDFQVSSGFSIQPLWNVHNGLRWRLTLPLRFEVTQTWGQSLYPYGWYVRNEIQTDVGTVDAVTGIRVLNAGPNPAFQKVWGFDLRNTLQLGTGLSLAESSAGLYQQSTLVLRASSFGTLLPADLELLESRPVPVLATQALLPENTSVSNVLRDALILQRIRPFLRLLRLDHSLAFLPLFVHNLWLEPLWDQGWIPGSNLWFGSYGLKLTATSTLFFHAPMTLALSFVFRWIRHVDASNPAWAFSVQGPL